MWDYKTVRSRRKTIAIYITKEASVEVRTPLKMPEAEIDRFVKSKAAWIEKHLTLRKQSMENKAAFELNYGDTAPIRGKECLITAKEGNRAGFDGERFYLPPGLPAAEIKGVVIQVYKAAAKSLLTERAEAFARQMGVTPSAVRINGARTRWGSCSGKNSVNFSWRLIMADSGVIDYVVVHELAHIREHNHSDRFWAVVESVLPDYRECQLRLRKLQRRLSNEDWD